MGKYDLYSRLISVSARSSSQSSSSLNPSTSRRPSSDGLRPSLNDRRARSIRIAKGLEGTEKPPEKDDASRAALNCLKLAFRYAQPRHLEKFLAEATTFFDTRDDTWSVPRWCCWLAGRFMEWTQPQYRFAIIKFWLDELETGARKTENSKRQETVLAVLVDQLSSPKTSVVNLAIGDVLSTLIDQIVLSPEKLLLKQGVLALASHIYYPEQINDLVGDTLSAVYELSENQERDKLPGNHDDAKVALLDCCYDMIDKKAGSGLKLSGEQLHASLSILNDPSSRVRLAYLRFLELAFRLNNPQSTSRSGGSTGANRSDIPAITVQPSIGLISPSNEPIKFARDAQVRLFAYLQHVTDLSMQESNVLQSVIEAIYAKRNPQILFDCVPVLVSWQNAEHIESPDVKPLVAKALQAIAKTWDAPPVSPSPSSDRLIASIAASMSLQQATSLTEEELRDKLSQPYSFSPISARNSVSHRRYSRRTRSPHGSVSHLSTHTAANRLSGPSSIFTTSLADLKQSLVSSPTSGNGNGTISHSHGNGSPSRSIAASTAASSFVERGSLTPPNGSAGLTITNGHGGHLSPKSIHGQRKPRLDRIIGSTDDTGLDSAGGRSPTK